AQDAQGGVVPPAARLARRAAARVQRVPPALQRGAAAHRVRRAPAGSRYLVSARAYPERLPPLEYPGHFLVKRVTNAGTFRFKDRLLFIANALKTHHIGLEEVDTGIWSIFLGRVLLARLDERDHIIRG